jgi:hypothetical protein
MSQHRRHGINTSFNWKRKVIFYRVRPTRATMSDVGNPTLAALFETLPLLDKKKLSGF